MTRLPTLELKRRVPALDASPREWRDWLILCGWDEGEANHVTGYRPPPKEDE